VTTDDDVQVSDHQALVVELMQALESGVHGDDLRRFSMTTPNRLNTRVWWTRVLGAEVLTA
jgi:hypothetical protein